MKKVIEFVIGKSVYTEVVESVETLRKHVEVSKEMWREIKEILTKKLRTWYDVIRAIENYMSKRFGLACRELGAQLNLLDLDPPCTVDQVITAVHWYFGTIYKAVESIYRYTHWPEVYHEIGDVFAKYGYADKIEPEYGVMYMLEKNPDLIEDLKEFLRRWLTTESTFEEIFAEAKSGAKVEAKPETKPAGKVLGVEVLPEKCRELTGVHALPVELREELKNYDPHIQEGVIRAYAIYVGLQNILVPGEWRMFSEYLNAMARRAGVPPPGTVDTIMLALKWLVNWQLRVVGRDFVEMRWKPRIPKLNELFQACAGVPPPPLIYTHISKFEEALFDVATEVICSRIKCSVE